MLGSPQVYREGGLSFRVYFNEGAEPPHVHVIAGDGTAKFWLNPAHLCWSKNLSPGQLRRAREQLLERHDFFIEQWNAIQARKR